MGRKIPGKKHRTVKDPEDQRRRRFAEIKDKVNNPPKNIDEQEMPKSILHIMKLKEKAKKQLAREKIRKPRVKSKKNRFDMKKALGKEIMMPGMDRPDQFIPEMEQGPNESLYNFTQRVQNVCNDLIREVKFEEQFNVEVKRDNTGQITEVKQIRVEKTSKKLKIREKRKNRKQSKMDAQEPIKDFAKPDCIQFGDIVHHPPTKLTMPGKKSKQTVEGNRKPGKGDLLLKTILPSNQKLQKLKQEERRKRVVEAFRMSKKSLLK